jgi:hypothetical protein
MTSIKRKLKVGDKVYVPQDRLMEFWTLWDHWMANPKTMANKYPWVKFVYSVTGIPEDRMWAYNFNNWTALSVYVVII